MSSSQESASTIDLFEAMLAILDKHGLIKQSELKEEKEHALLEFTRYVEDHRGQHKGLNEKLRRLLSTLNIDPTLAADVECVIKEIEVEIIRLKERIVELETLNALEKANVYAYDALTLFIYYYIEPSIQIKNPKWLWRDFTNRWGELEAAVIEETNRFDVIDPKEDPTIQEHPLVKTFVDEVEAELKKAGQYSIPLVVIRQMIASRHRLVHHDRQSVVDQRIVINQLVNFECHRSYPFVHQLNKIVHMLQDLDIDRKNTKLRRIK